MEIGDTSEKAVNINENAENTEKLGSTMMVSDISIFTLAVENLQFICDQCKRTNSSEKGLTQHIWMKQYPSKDFRHYNFEYCSQVYENTGQDKMLRR